MLHYADTAPATIVGEYFSKLRQAIERVPLEAVGRAVEMILETTANDRRVYVMGNGGSAATATHFVCDLVKTAHVPGHKAVRAFSLVDNTSLLTAWANDTEYRLAFAAQVGALVEPGDLVIGFSASGNSPNVVAGFEAAVAYLRARTIAVIGFEGGVVRNAVDLAIHVPCHDFGLSEDVHMAVGHAITAAVLAVHLPAAHP